MVHLKNRADTEDIFQTVFLKYVLSSVSFESEGKGLEHSRRHQRLQGHAQELLPQAHGALGRAPRAAGAFAAGQQAVLEAVLSLPPQYKIQGRGFSPLLPGLYRTR